jgi:hypothetical protein
VFGTERIYHEVGERWIFIQKAGSWRAEPLRTIMLVVRKLPNPFAGPTFGCRKEHKEML